MLLASFKIMWSSWSLFNAGRSRRIDRRPRCLNLFLCTTPTPTFTKKFSMCSGFVWVALGADGFVTFALVAQAVVAAGQYNIFFSGYLATVATAQGGGVDHFRLGKLQRGKKSLLGTLSRCDSHISSQTNIHSSSAFWSGAYIYICAHHAYIHVPYKLTDYFTPLLRTKPQQKPDQSTTRIRCVPMYCTRIPRRV